VKPIHGGPSTWVVQQQSPESISPTLPNHAAVCTTSYVQRFRTEIIAKRKHHYAHCKFFY